MATPTTRYQLAIRATLEDTQGKGDREFAG